MDDKIYVDCGCYTEGVCVEADVDNKEFSFAYFKIGFDSGKLTLWNKLRYIWNVVSTGQPYVDMAILPATKALEISNFIVDNCRRMEVEVPTLIIQKEEDGVSRAFKITVSSTDKSIIKEALTAAQDAMGIQ